MTFCGAFYAPTHPLLRSLIRVIVSSAELIYLQTTAHIHEVTHVHSVCETPKRIQITKPFERVYGLHMCCITRSYRSENPEGVES